MRFAEGRMAPYTVSFDFRNPFAQVEVVGTSGWLALPGTGFRREPYTKLLLHQGGEIYLDGEPKVEVFAFDDPYMREVEHFDGAIRGEHALAGTSRTPAPTRWSWKPCMNLSGGRPRSR